MSVTWPVLFAAFVPLSHVGRIEDELPDGLLAYKKYFVYQEYNKDPHFIIFYGINKSPAEGSFGFYAVNPWTGDVWQLWGCYKLTSPALRKSQAAIRKRFTQAELKHYTELSDLKPECIVDDGK
mgnify:FL=1